MLRVTEMFYSIQGEGHTQGNPTIFIRLWGCNLHCGYVKTNKGLYRDEKYWLCDSLSSWYKGKEDAKVYGNLHFLYQDILRLLENPIMPVTESPELVDIVFTGGEPTLYIKENDNNNLKQLIFQLDTMFNDIYFETNGTVDISKFGDTLQYVSFNCSPKLKNSGNDLEERYKPDVLYQIAQTGLPSCFKFVVNEDTKWEEIEGIVKDCEIPEYMVYLMPEGQTREEIEKHLPKCAEFCKANGWRLSNRFQVQIWNKTMGV